MNKVYMLNCYPRNDRKVIGILTTFKGMYENKNEAVRAGIRITEKGGEEFVVWTVHEIFNNGRDIEICEYCYRVEDSSGAIEKWE